MFRTLWIGGYTGSAKAVTVLIIDSSPIHVPSAGSSGDTSCACAGPSHIFMFCRLPLTVAQVALVLGHPAADSGQTDRQLNICGLSCYALPGLTFWIMLKTITTRTLQTCAKYCCYLANKSDWLKLLACVTDSYILHLDECCRLANSTDNTVSCILRSLGHLLLPSKKFHQNLFGPFLSNSADKRTRFTQRHYLLQQR